MRYLIIGNGAAGATAAEEIRRRDPVGTITLVSAEKHPMYSRPGLAYVLLNEIPARQVLARQPEWYAEHRIELVYGTAQSLDTNTRQVKLAHGQSLRYDRLLIATGARAVPLPYPGADLGGVVFLDTLDGTQDILKRLKHTRRAVVIGGGITALEMAEGFAHHKIETHYLVRKEVLWSAVFNAEESRLLAERMTAHGVHIHYNTEITEVLGDKKGHVTGVKLTNGETLACDLLGAGIGVKAQLDWVTGTPIKADRAILVNEHLATSVPDVYAAGDCAQVWDRWTQRHTQDVLWPTAIATGRIAGRNMSGANEAYIKGTPFNACLLFGLHITAIGQLGGTREEAEPEVFQHLSRGASDVWATTPHGYLSAWSQQEFNTVRLALSGDRLVGALLLGDQTLADPLRAIIDQQTNISAIRPHLEAGGPRMAEILKKFWKLTQMQAMFQPAQAKAEALTQE